jgi:hypothetical protein
VPRLRQDASWQILHLRPGREPFKSLAEACVGLLGPEKNPVAQLKGTANLSEMLEQGRVALADVARKILRANPDDRLLLVIDQFEEVYALGSDASGQERFVDAILAAAGTNGSSRDPRLAMIITLRADFLGRALSYRPLADALQRGDLKLGPMTAEESREAIEQPAHKLNVKFEKGLSQRVLDAVHDRPGDLPLLEFSLTQLWAQQENGVMTHAAYDSMHGLAGALEQHADDVYSTLDEGERDICRRVFLRLVQPGEGTEDTRRRAAIEELLPADREDRSVWNVIQRLTHERLLTTEAGDAGQDEGFVEIAHETLIHSWSLLRKWIDSERDALSIHRRLSDAASEWKKHDHKRGYLYEGVRLAAARKWSKTYADRLNALERLFLRESTILHLAQMGLLVLLGTLVATTLLAFYLRNLEELRNVRDANGRILEQERTLGSLPDFIFLQLLKAWHTDDCNAVRNLVALCRSMGEKKEREGARYLVRGDLTFEDLQESLVGCDKWFADYVRAERRYKLCQMDSARLAYESALEAMDQGAGPAGNDFYRPAIRSRLYGLLSDVNAPSKP